MTELRVRDIAAMPPDTTTQEFADLIGDDYVTLRLCVLAEATRKNTPPALGQLLREPEWHEDWFDTLLAAEGSHQIAVMRSRFTHGPGSRDYKFATATLNMVRRRIQEVRGLLKASQPPPRPAPREPEHMQVRRATRELVRVHLTEFEDLLTDRVVLLGHSPHVAHKRHLQNLGPWAARAGYPMPAVTANVNRLLDATDPVFELIVTDDIRDTRHEPDLEHPLVLSRWGSVLTRIAQRILTDLDLPWNRDMSVADKSLKTTGLERQQAYRRINALRYLVHVRQRWMECRSATRTFETALLAWYTPIIEGPRHDTWQELRERYPDEYAKLLDDARCDLAAEEAGA